MQTILNYAACIGKRFRSIFIIGGALSKCFVIIELENMIDFKIQKCSSQVK